MNYRNYDCDHPYTLRTYCCEFIVDPYEACEPGTQPSQIEMNEDTEEVIITSPGYPVSYADKAECQWHFTVEDGYVLSVNFISLNIEPE